MRIYLCAPTTGAGEEVREMERACCEFKCGADFEMKCIETDEGYRIEVKGDKDKLKEHGPGCCWVPFRGMHWHGGRASCC
jgi:hypothetical protein